MLSPVHSICDFYCKPVSEGGCQVNNFGYMERQSEKNSHSQSGFSAVVPGIWLCPYNIWSFFLEVGRNFPWDNTRNWSKSSFPYLIWLLLRYVRLKWFVWVDWRSLLYTESKNQPRELPLAAFSCRGLNQFSLMTQNMGASASLLHLNVDHCLSIGQNSARLHANQ